MTNSITARQFAEATGGKMHGGRGSGPCPVCQPERRKDQKACTFRDEGGHFLAHCFKLGCGFRDILVAAGFAPGTYEVDQMAIENAHREREAQAAKSLARARSLWDYGGAIAGTKGEAYLRGRGISCAMPESLRWAGDTYHGPTGQYCGAIVGDISTGGVHRTYFNKQGVRLDKATGTDSHKMMLGPCQGGAVRLSEAVGPLVVCEGIETGLSLLSGLLSGPAIVWACLSTSGLQGVVLPSTAGKLVIAADGDDAGKGAGDKLAMRATSLGWQVSMLPAPNGRDWNDVLQRGVAA